MNKQIICDTNCVDCKFYWCCESETKLDEQSRDFWLSEREKYDSEVDE